MTPEDKLLQFETRRQFFSRCGVGVGKIALASLIAEQLRSAESAKAVNPTAPKPPHFPAKVKNVIYLFMAGAPSQLELFDYKPALQQYDGKSAPESLLKGKRFAFMDTFAKEPPKLLGTRREFRQYGKSGKHVSELLPNIGGVADDLAFLSGVSTENFNHGPAKCFVNTGSTRFGRPSIGAWVSYGIGSESQDLPGFVVLESGPRGPRGGAALWGSGFLPSAHQGVPFRSGGDPILDLSSPKGISTRNEQQALEAIRDLNMAKLAETGDPEITTRIAAYEMAYRMQTSGPELIDFSKETRKTLEMYGAEPGKSSYANNCLLARRLVERGVRFVQLFHEAWDQHGNLVADLKKNCLNTDRAGAALVKDLKRRGLLDDTLVIWGGEFGRTPMVQGGNDGRDHHPNCFSMWLAGGGVKPGLTLGESDEFGFNATTDKVHVHDLHATLLHLLGFDHTKLTYRFQGRDFRLTDVSGEVVEKLLA